MKISYQWLKEYIDFDLSPSELAHRLTMLGLEVEGIEGEGEEAVLELSITPNRGDCLSHIGVAREVAMLTGGKLKLPAPDLPALKTHPSKTSSWEVSIAAPDLCPRYAACIIKGVKIAPSPDWLARRLAQAGLRPINNIVDITNYILLEWGQPLHAFDLELLSGNKIIVRRAQKGERFITLDEQEHRLDEQMLVISDSEKAVALGGVMGGLNSEVNPATQNILLECAYFDPLTISHTSRKLGLVSESSFRFERGTDGANLLQPLQCAIGLIQKLAGGKPLEPIIDSYPTPLPQVEIYLRFERVNQILGTRLRPQEIKNLLTRMFFQITGEQPEGIKLQVPGFRREVSREIDLIEEIVRLYGYGQIPTSIPTGTLPEQTATANQGIKDKIRCFLTSCGLWEVINFSFTSQDFCSKLNLDNQVLSLSNPLTQEAGVLRTTLLPGLLQNIAHNLNHQVPDLKLFEIGHCFWQNSSKLPQEKAFLALALTGKTGRTSWHASAQTIDFYELKGIVDGLLKHLGFSTWRWERGKASYLHPGQSAELVIGGEKIGQGGCLHPQRQRELQLQQQVFVWELDLEQLLLHLPKQCKVVSLPRYPATFRDLAVVVEAVTPAVRVEEVIVSSAGKFLKEIHLFDVYSGNQIAEGKKSLAFALTYQSEEGTLGEEQINASQAKVVQALAEKLSASLRE